MSQIPNKNATVLVVGAGPSGLVALKELREAGITAVAVDARPDIGGAFAPSNRAGREGPGRYLTTTNMFMAYSDFPPPDRAVRYWSQEEYHAYLESYIAHFGLGPAIRLGVAVESAALGADGWRVSLRTAGGSVEERSFDYMVVAAGANHVPKLPEEAFRGFGGEVLHSSQFRSPEQVAGKRVLVVGAGESSADAIASAATTAEKVTVWSRRHPNIAPRFLGDMIDDVDYNETSYLPTQQGRDRRPGEILEAVLTSRIVRNMPLAAWATVLQKGLFSDMKAAHGKKSPAGLMADWCLNSYKTDFFSGDLSSVPTKTMVLCTAVAREQADLVVAPRLRGCQGGVVFEEPAWYGREETDTKEDLPIDVDVIVACTGFKVSFDWIKAPGLETNPRYWFKHCFPTSGDLARRMAFLGYARPHQGGIPQCAEMLARYLVQVIREDVALPANYRDLALNEAKCENDCFHLSKYVTPLVDYPSFMLSVARLAGCEPAVPRTPGDMVKYWTFPLWSCFFRTQGPGAKEDKCREVLDRFGTFDGVAPMPLAAVQVLLTFLVPALNFVSFVLATLFKGRGRAGPLAAYQFRMSKMHIMSGNTLRLRDFGAPLVAQYVAGMAMVVHGVSSLFQTKSGKKVDRLV